MDELASDSKVKIAGSDIDGIARGKIISKDKFVKIIKSGMGFCDVVFVFKYLLIIGMGLYG